MFTLSWEQLLLFKSLSLTVCPQGGDSWDRHDGKTCSCSAAGINCVCGQDTLVCLGGTQKWVDPETCEATCIRGDTCNYVLNNYVHNYPN